MHDEIDAVLAKLARERAAGDWGAEALEQTLAAVQRLTPETEEDRARKLVAYVELINAQLPYAGPDIVRDLVVHRDRVCEEVTRCYGSPDAPYMRSRVAVEQFARTLAEGGDAAKAATATLSELESLIFDEADALALATATLSVHALHAAYDWSHGDDPATLDNPLVATLRQLRTALSERGFDRDAVLEAASVVRLCGEGAEASAAGLLIVFGLGLQARPDALPGLEPVRDEVMARMAELAGQHGDALGGASEHAAAAEIGFAERCDALLADMGRRLRDEGYSEHLVVQAFASLQEFRPMTEEDSHALLSAQLAVIDLVASYAPAEAAQSWVVVREAVERPGDPIPLDSDALRAQGVAVLQRMQAEFAGGEPVGAMRALLALQVLAARTDLGDPEGVSILLELIAEMVQIAAQHAEPAREALGKDLANQLRVVSREAKSIITSDGRDLVGLQSGRRRSNG